MSKHSNFNKVRLIAAVLLVAVAMFGAGEYFELLSFTSFGASKDIFAIDEGNFIAPDGKTYQHKISGVIDLEGIPTPQGGALTYRTQKTIFVLLQSFNISSQPSRDYYFKINFECGTWWYTAACKGGYIKLSLYKNNNLSKTTSTGYWGYDTSGNYDRLTTAPSQGYVVSDGLLFYPEHLFTYKEGGGSACCSVPVVSTRTGTGTIHPGDGGEPIVVPATYITVGRVLSSSHSDVPITIAWNDDTFGQLIAPINPPTPIGFNAFLSILMNWLSTLFASLPLSITGESTIKPNTEYIYNVSVQAPTNIDADASDGSFAVRYGYIAIVNKNGEIASTITNGLKVSDNLVRSFSYVTPSSFRDLAVVAVITETKATYQNGNWSWSPETIIAKESQLLQYEQPMPPPGRGIIDLVVSSLFAWLKSLFSWL